MYIFSALIMLLLPLTSYSAPIIVDSVDGRNAKVYVPPNITIKPGDELFTKPQTENTSTTPDNSATLESKPKANEQAKPAASKLHSRHHNLSVDLESASTKVKIEGVSTKSSHAQIDVNYGYNFGYVQPFAEISSSSLSDDDIKTAVTAIGCRFNFIKNIPENNLIPYAGLSLGFMNEDADSLSEPGKQTNIQGLGESFGIGLDWYPFGEYIAVEVQSNVITAKLDGTGFGSSSVKANVAVSDLAVGYVLSF